MDGPVVEFIKLVGGIAGLVTFAFTAYDRIIRNTPVLGLGSIAHPIYRGVGPQVFIRIKNISSYDILITSWSVSREGYSISPDLSGQSAIDTISGVEWIASVGPHQERQLGLGVRDSELQGEAALPVVITVGWKRAGVIYPFSSGQTKLTTTTNELARLQKAARREADRARQYGPVLP
jgi:hypothetical protein